MAEVSRKKLDLINNLRDQKLKSIYNKIRITLKNNRETTTKKKLGENENSKNEKP